jgi:hypothetical protein
VPINHRLAIIATALVLSACNAVSEPLVTNGDITKHMEDQGYSKVLLRDNFSCGKAGQGKHFVATKSATVRTGQICYLKQGGKVTYALDELATVKPKTATDALIPNHWKAK